MTERYEPFFWFNSETNGTHFYCGAGCGHEIGFQGPFGSGPQELDHCMNCMEGINWNTKGKKLNERPGAADG